MKNRLMGRRPLRIASLLAIIVLVLSTSLPAFAASGGVADNRPNSDTWCWCVGYALNKLELSPVGGVWANSNAKDMANENYWQAHGEFWKAQGDLAKAKGNKTLAQELYAKAQRVQRYNSRAAQAGDVIVMQPNAHFWLYDIKEDRFAEYKGLLGEGAQYGHIGIVQWATYDDKAAGWYIDMLSAGDFPGHGDQQFADAGCSNVASSWMFVPNGPAVTFWRQK